MLEMSLCIFLGFALAFCYLAMVLFGTLILPVEFYSSVMLEHYNRKLEGAITTEERQKFDAAIKKLNEKHARVKGVQAGAASMAGRISGLASVHPTQTRVVSGSGHKELPL